APSAAGSAGPAGPARGNRCGARGDGGAVARGLSRTDRTPCQLRVWPAREVAEVGAGCGPRGLVVAGLEAGFQQTPGGLARQRTARVKPQGGLGPGRSGAVGVAAPDTT